jgi:hypothetical protein
MGTRMTRIKLIDADFFTIKQNKTVKIGLISVIRVPIIHIKSTFFQTIQSAFYSDFQ